MTQRHRASEAGTKQAGGPNVAHKGQGSIVLPAKHSTSLTSKLLTLPLKKEHIWIPEAVQDDPDSTPLFRSYREPGVDRTGPKHYALVSGLEKFKAPANSLGNKTQQPPKASHGRHAWVVASLRSP